MSSKKSRSLLGMLLTLVLAIINYGCGGGSAAPQQSAQTLAISVSVSQSSAGVAPSGTVQVTAIVVNDPSNKGVTWTVSCSGGSCGNAFPAATLSGAATTYTAPNVIVTAMLTATSVADPTKSASVNITVSGIAVTVSPSNTTVQVGGTAKFTATVVNDPAANGVTWTVSCSAAACGSVSPTSTASGAATTYSAPTMPPASNLAVTLTATSVSDTVTSASVTITVPFVLVSVGPSSATVPPNQSQQFMATLQNDSANAGVSWSLMEGFDTCQLGRACTPVSYSVCASACGSVSAATSASGAPVTYAAPSQFTPPRPPCGPFGLPCTHFLGVFIRATSVTDTSAFGQASIVFPPISISVSPTSPSVAVNATQQVTATVANDGTNRGVTWTLTQGGAACSPGCGTISATSSASGAAITYTGPSTQPGFPLVTLTAISVADTTKSASVAITVTTSTGAICGNTGNEALLNGQYAFLLQGTDEADVVVIAGSLTADGTGKVTGGQVDLSHSANAGGLAGVAIIAAGSSYTVGADHRGCLALSNASGTTMFFRFALGSLNANNIATKGHMIEFDDTSGGGTRTTGTLRLQDPTSFSAAQFKGTYAFELRGASSGSGRGVMAGVFTTDGQNTVTGGSFDFNDGSTFTSDIAFPGGTPFTCCSASGRGTIGTGTLQDNGAAWVPGFVFYMISNTEAFVSGGLLYNPTNNCCAANVALGLASGEAIAAPGPFSASSLSGPSIWRYAELSGTSPDNVDAAHLATANADGAGNVTSATYENSGGTFTSGSSTFSYAVSSTGRVTFSGAAAPPLILYVYGQNQGFVLGTGAEIAPANGVIEPQATGPFNTALFAGTFMLGTEIPTANLQITACNCWNLTFESGGLTAASGNAAGTVDQSGPSGLSASQNVNFGYSISPDGSGNVGTGTTAILISPSKLVFINNTSINPTITVVEK